MEERTKILIVDDEPINLDFFDVMLSKLGFEIGRAEDGEEALEQIKSFNPDLIILDNVMPKMSGWQVTRIVKQDPLFEKYHDIPIIMFSAMDDVKDKIEGFELGVEDYITKPFNFSEVLARIRAVLRGKELYQQILHREKELAVSIDLRSRFDSFADQAKESLGTLLSDCEHVKANDENAITGYLGKVHDEVGAVLRSLDLLEKEIHERRSEPLIGSSALDDLDKRFDSHFRRLKENADTMGEVRE
ncbi:response regulator transcription factor [Sediminispirochaeta smaragdinae]|jgi:CheY-like chemotaxis protein|uniref:Response regulator receiver protein n=1 Tax=Sediminispirochaeta smaragdinae (strain DSM 11293 / JCM 15392 / SEBR 4228) TaxID=573413 RepID=E1R5F3_SEDSS|nr:response regulator [Sediminispirochaeta smaragdinae]ADK82281.1 response regulator receiver protein [Sediminispirochaeta smaragdinae DSM 11293]